MFERMEITERMAALLTARGVKPRSIKPTLAKACGISYEAVRQWFAGETNSIKNEHLLTIASHYKTSVDWLLTGAGEMDATYPGSLASAHGQKGSETIEAAKSLLNIATPRSKKVIERIAALDQQQRLSDEDIKLLEQIIDRFSAK